MEFIVNNWALVLIAIALIAVTTYETIQFLKKPTTAQIESVQAWLLYAVAEAEKELGSKTGQLKLSYVYGMFIQKFPTVAAIMPYVQFSELVDGVLEKFRNILSSNSAARDYIDG